MLKINFYNLGHVENDNLKFAVIAARHKGKWVFVRHKERTTWEMPGGHREENEDINNTASRELTEETGAESFNIYPLCIYSVISDGIESFGQLFYADIITLGELPDLEIGEVKLYDEIPGKLTYPLIQPYLFERTLEFANIDVNVSHMKQKNDLKISDMLALSYKLWEEHKETWSPMKPEYGKDFILYMIEEIGEAIAIIKKKGENKIMVDNDVRARFVEELGDVLMYYMDVLNRFNISSEEFSDIYLKKFESNMRRDYEQQYESLK